MFLYDRNLDFITVSFLNIYETIYFLRTWSRDNTFLTRILDYLTRSYLRYT